MLKGFVCPSTVPTAGNRNDPEWCLGSCPHPCVSPPLLAAMHSAEASNIHKDNYISSSMIASGSCSRQTFYERKFDFYELPRKRWWPFRGVIAHRIIEDSYERTAKYGWLQELRLTTDLEYPEYPAPVLDEAGKFTGDFDTSKNLVITLGGTTDAYRYHPTEARLDDYKTMADAKVKMFVSGEKGGTLNKNADDSWVMQLNIYGWLIGRTEITPEWRKKLKAAGIKVPKTQKLFPAPKTLQIQGLGMMELPLTGSEYLPMRTYKPVPIEAIPVLPAEEVEAFVRTQAIKWHRYLVLGELPPVVTEDKRWMCKNCVWNSELVEGGKCIPNAKEGEPDHT